MLNFAHGAIVMILHIRIIPFAPWAEATCSHEVVIETHSPLIEDFEEKFDSKQPRAYHCGHSDQIFASLDFDNICLAHG